MNGTPTPGTKKCKLWSVPRSTPNTNTPTVVDEGPNDRIYSEFLRLSGQNPNPAVRFVMTDEHNAPLFAG